MNTALAARDDVTVEGEIIEHRPPMTLFGTDDPAAVVERATRVATVLADVIKQRRLSARIGNRDHIMLEGWTLLGSMLGVFGEVEWTRPIDRGWEARAVARTMAGATVGAAEAMCSRDERTWSNRDEYAVRSMAQTRALSKALRLPLGFIVELAGFAATPAEEMDAIEQPGHGGGSPSSPRRAPASNQYRRHELALLLHDMGVGPDYSLQVADRIGIPSTERPMSDASMDRLIEAIESERERSAPDPAPSTPLPEGSAAATPAASGPPSTEPPAAPTLDDVLAVSGGEVIPPKPGTKAYRELPSGTERANAKAYWDKKPEPEQESLAVTLGAPES